jgi:hypothetical protein
MISNRTDIATIIGKGLLGAIPFVGPLAAEIVGAIIPNQRIDRIESLLMLLESKISMEDRSKVEKRIISSEFVDLIEDGFIQASRALSEERIEYIACLLKNSLTEDEVKYIEYKSLLSILNNLNDLEVLILKSKIISYRGHPEYDEFWKSHKNAVTPQLVHMGSTQEELDRHTIFKTYELHLTNLGLLKAKFKKPKRGELPEFDDKTGMIKAQGYDVTRLGQLLLRSIDQGGEI